jgi:hypothetical protein
MKVHINFEGFVLLQAAHKSATMFFLLPCMVMSNVNLYTIVSFRKYIWTNLLVMWIIEMERRLVSLMLWKDGWFPFYLNPAKTMTPIVMKVFALPFSSDSATGFRYIITYVHGCFNIPLCAKDKVLPLQHARLKWTISNLNMTYYFLCVSSCLVSHQILTATLLFNISTSLTT